MKHISFLIILLLGVLMGTPAFSDPKGTTAARNSKKSKTVKPVLRRGTLFQLHNKRRLPVFFSRSYRKISKDIFETEYSVYDPQKKAIAQIIARNDRRKRQVSVSVRDLQVKGFPIVNTEVYAYTEPFPGPFGHIGKVGAGSKDNPGQIMVRFAGKRTDFIQVISIADVHEDMGKNLQVYILEKR